MMFETIKRTVALPVCIEGWTAKERSKWRVGWRDDTKDFPIDYQLKKRLEAIKKRKKAADGR